VKYLVCLIIITATDKSMMDQLSTVEATDRTESLGVRRIRAARVLSNTSVFRLLFVHSESAGWLNLISGYIGYGAAPVFLTSLDNTISIRCQVTFVCKYSLCAEDGSRSLAFPGCHGPRYLDECPQRNIHTSRVSSSVKA
jgi:hypothetical protein